jgi:hypothetical protein
MSSPLRTPGIRAATFAAVAVAVALAGCAHGSGSLRDQPTPAGEKACAGFDALAVFNQEPVPENALARGQSFYCLGLYVASVTVLTDHAIGKPVAVALAEAIASPETPPLADDRLPALRWLVYIHRRFPGWERINDAVGEVARADLERPELADVRDDLHALAARFEYQKGRFAKAVELLRMIPASSPLHVEAVLLEGAINVRVESPLQAMVAFEEVVRSIPAGADPKRARERDLAVISIARVQYAMGQLDAAGRNYDSLPPSSTYWAAAALEGAWTRYKLNDFPGALARQRTLAARSGEVPIEMMAEATALEAMIALHGKHPEASEPIIKRFNDVYPVVFTQAKTLSLRETGALYELAFSVRAGGALPPPFGAGPTKLLLADPPLARRFEEIDEIRREETRFQALGEQLRSSPVGEEARDALWIRRTGAENEAGEQFRRRLQRLSGALGEQIKQIIKVEYEMLQAKRVDDIDRIE